MNGKNHWFWKIFENWSQWVTFLGDLKKKKFEINSIYIIWVIRLNQWLQFSVCCVYELFTFVNEIIFVSIMI